VEPEPSLATSWPRAAGPAMISSTSRDAARAGPTPLQSTAQALVEASFGPAPRRRRASPRRRRPSPSTSSPTCRAREVGPGDNIHFDRARPDYPTRGSNLYRPTPPDSANRRDVTWVQLQDLWADQVSAPGATSRTVRVVDPSRGRPRGSSQCRRRATRATRRPRRLGASSRAVMTSTRPQHRDAQPLLVVLHHDGDNYGGGTTRTTTRTSPLRRLDSLAADRTRPPQSKTTTTGSRRTGRRDPT
jgi:hypothetical protein